MGTALIAISVVNVQPAAAVPLACQFPSNETAAARICMEDSGQIDGAFATWKNSPITFESGAAVGDWVKNYVDMMPVPGTGIEIGLRSTKAGQVGRTYEPYWAENGGQTYQEHAIAPARGPASADGLQHSYMVLRSGRTTQWDVLFDFNPVGRTTLQTQGYTKGFNVQLETNNLRNTSIGEMEDRFQYLAPDGQLLRFDRAKVFTQVTTTCSSTNPPPLCFNATLVGSPKAIAWRVSKPTGAAPTSSAPPNLSAPAATSLNGVDQRSLAACMASDPARCMKDVPGLARCVQARLVCNSNVQAVRSPATSTAGDSRLSAEKFKRLAATRFHDRAQAAWRSTAFKMAGSHLTAEQIKRLAATRFHLTADQIQTRTITATGYDQTAGTHLSQTWDANLPLLVVTSTGKVRAGTNNTQYPGLTAVYDPASGQLLHAALGLRRPFA
ncbi:hypothetical protein ACFVDH_15435 [Streptomyces sp. NPDC057674]|uniref:hypothetical protein n=1 Tax=Streptomyces sp. NPDC057674 TaxID=3346203 RepID=UPI0036CFFD40